MICPKCAAQMFPDRSVRFYASKDYTPDLNDARADCATSWHCLCGQYVDRVILANRARHADEQRLVGQAEAIAVYAELELREKVRA